jgi:AraC-like DNA-binding protein
VRGLPPGYSEWQPPAALRPDVVCLWAQVTPDGGDRDGLVLPDACTDLIWEQGRGAFVAGPDTGPVPTQMMAGTVLVGVRFRPSAGGPAFGVPLSELRDQRIDLTDLRSGDAKGLPGTLDPDTALAAALDVAASLIACGRSDPAVTRAVSLLRDPRVRAEDVATEVGLSLRQLRRRCHAAVGYGPKTLQRILRFRRFVSRIDAIAAAPAASRPAASRPAASRPVASHPVASHWGQDAGDLAALAAEAGYADQAHLTRECGQFAGLTPAALIRQRGLAGVTGQPRACRERIAATAAGPTAITEAISAR